MSDEPPTPTQGPETPQNVSQTREAQQISPEPRSALINQARIFLRSTQIQHQDPATKREFLKQRGLTPEEIDSLLHELPPALPSIPPRTYPQKPPSRLSGLLLGVLRLFSWLGIGSTALLLIYWRYLLPRITASFDARRALANHQFSLVKKLTESLQSFKEGRSDTFSVLPKPRKYQESPLFSSCTTLEEVIRKADSEKYEVRDIGAVTLLRCAIQEFQKENSQTTHPNTEELFQLLESKIPWLITDAGVQYEHKLWETLSTCALFISSPVPRTVPNESDAEVEPDSATPLLVSWEYYPLPPPPDTELVASLNTLRARLPVDSASKHRQSQQTMESLSSLTGYISSQIYVPYRMPASGNMSFGREISPEEAELKKEIRALKGLVLNRRTFMATIPRPPIVQRTQS